MDPEVAEQGQALDPARGALAPERSYPCCSCSCSWFTVTARTSETSNVLGHERRTRLV